MSRVVLAFIGVLTFSAGRGQPRFEEQMIDDQVAIGYGLAIGDVDGDGHADILLADKKQFVWYRNGDWKKFIMADNLTERDNVCIAARDIDGDGKVEVAVGAQWNPGETADTARSGSVHYLVRPEDPTLPWRAVKLHHEPTVHRMRWVRVEEEKFLLIVVPLHGRGNRNGEGDGVRILAYEKPNDPSMPWQHTVVDQSMHLTHNFDIIEDGTHGEYLLIGGREGIRELRYAEGQWKAADEVTDRGFGEVRKGARVLAGISPMHGNQLVVIDNGAVSVLTEDLNQGHALAVADLVPGGNEEIVVGWREPDKENKVGVRIFVAAAGNGWSGSWIDDNGIACEDLQVADLDGDGREEIVAAGRATHNLKIYWNKN